jgi:hypothetical protein
MPPAGSSNPLACHFGKSIQGIGRMQNTILKYLKETGWLSE